MFARSLLRLSKAGTTRALHTSAARRHKDLIPIIEDQDLSLFGEPLPYTPLPSRPALPAPTTAVADPREHTSEQLSLWYTIPDEDLKKYFTGHYLLPHQYHDLLPVFEHGAPIMIRKPALSVIKYLKQIDVTAVTAPKFILYGRDGTGKTMSLHHVAHALAKEGFVLFQVPSVNRWIRQLIKNPAEIAPSSILPDKWDHIADAVSFLKLFQRANSGRLEAVLLSQHYQLSSRESVQEGDPLTALVELGIGRPPLAAACVLLLSRELRAAANRGSIRLAVLVDELNACWSLDSVYKRDDRYRTPIPAADFTLVCAVTELLRCDWRGGCVVGAVDVKTKPWAERGAGATRSGLKPGHNHNRLNHLPQLPQLYTPRHLLGSQGWDHLEPFVPVRVPEYSSEEVASTVRMMAALQWVSRAEALTDDGMRQVAFVTGGNAWHLNDYLSSL